MKTLTRRASPSSVVSIIHRGGHLIALLQSIVPEVDEGEEEEQESTLSTTFLHPEEPQKSLKRKRSLVELVLVSEGHQRPGSRD